MRNLLFISWIFFVTISCQPPKPHLPTTTSESGIDDGTGIVAETEDASKLLLDTPLPSISFTQTSLKSKSTVTPDNSLCDWFFVTQSLRTSRLSGFNEFYDFVRTHDMTSISEAEVRQFVDILVSYQPYQEEFVKDWIELAPHPNGLIFWEKELESVELKIEGIYEMESGLQENNNDLFAHGWDVFKKSLQDGNEAESAMLQIRQECIEL